MRDDPLQDFLETPEQKAKFARLMIYGQVVATLLMTLGFIYIILWAAGVV